MLYFLSTTIYVLCKLIFAYSDMMNNPIVLKLCLLISFVFVLYIAKENL